MTQQDILDAYPDEVFLFADGLDDAILGIDASGSVPRVIYSVSKCVDIFTEQGMTAEEAVEYFEFNTCDAYMGDQTPIWCDDLF